MKKVSALIVDDNEIDRYILIRQLKSAGIDSIYERDDGSYALEMLENFEANNEENGLDFPPSIIFLDINMPIIGGFEFLERFEKVREKLGLQSVVIMMYSSSENEEDIAKASSFAFVKDFLVKGHVSQDELKEKLRLYAK